MASFIMNGNKISPPQLAEHVVKVVVVGEPKCGKTTFIHSHYDHNFPRDIYSHNGARVYPCYFKENAHQTSTSIFEIPSDPDFHPEQRIPHYEQADVIVFMYAIDNPVSLQMLVSRWIPEAKPAIDTFQIPVAFVGNKKDLREDQQVIDRLALHNQTPVTTQQGRVLLHQVSHDSAMQECSTKDLDEVNSAFKTIFSLVTANEEIVYL